MAKTTFRFRDTVAAYDAMMSGIDAGRFAPVYLLMGEESYFIDRIAERIAATAVDEAARDFNQLTVYGKDSDAGQVINLCRQLPMMGARQLIVLKEAQQLRSIDNWRSTCKSPRRRPCSSSATREECRQTVGFL